ncbi:MAG TPA: LON peptidase substrate-binding domain-containing protein [Actinomycetales bacterium]|nr:LON peptidase substrate-binding domain-containing protein [Actinomycetales bacterium]
MQQLPLFPLGTVLVPGLVLPLNVFEPRYRRLVADLMARPEEARVFGVIAIKAGHEVGEHGARALYPVGCTAVVRTVETKPDGGYELVTSGAVRFRLHGLDDDAGTPYLTGLVESMEEPDGEGADLAALARRVGLAFAAYRDGLGAEQTGLPSSPKVLSYLVTAGMVLDLADRQALLEHPDTTGRLRAALALLARERVLIETLRAVPSPRPLGPAPNLN